MLDQTLTLPEDPEELRSFTARLLAEVKAQAILIEKLRHQLAGHRAHRFGASSETAEQLQLALETSEIAAAAMTARMRLPDIEEKDKPKRRPIPDHVPRMEVELTPGTDACADCGGRLRRIGEDVTEDLEYVPGRFIVNRIVRPRLTCTCCERFVQAPLPFRPIERGRPGPGLLAHVLVSKYADHLSLYRQSQIFDREGLDLDRSTLADWVTSFDWTDRLKWAKTNISMDDKARYLDSIFIERLWQSHKYECVYLHARETGSQARAGVGRWITFFNHQRPMPPMAVKRPPWSTVSGALAPWFRPDASSGMPSCNLVCGGTAVEHQNEPRMEVRGSKRVSRIEILDGPTGRRRWPDDLKARIVAGSFQPGARVCDVAAKYGLIARHLSGRRAQARKGELVVPIDAAPAFVPLVMEPLADAAAAAAVGGTGVIRVEICGAVVHVAPDCSPERVAALAAALRKVL